MNELIITLDQAVTALLAGKVGVMPTDTVYGLVARAEDQQAVERLYGLKSREHKPGTVIAASLEQLLSLGITQTDLDKVKQWWPNPLSAILPFTHHAYLDQSVGSLAVRVVADAQLKELLDQTGPLLTSSANLPTQPVATSIEEAFDYFGSQVDFYVNGGVIVNHLPSTLIRPTTRGIEVLRQGSIAIESDFTSPQ